MRHISVTLCSPSTPSAAAAPAKIFSPEQMERLWCSCIQQCFTVLSPAYFDHVNGTCKKKGFTLEFQNALFPDRKMV